MVSDCEGIGYFSGEGKLGLEVLRAAPYGLGAPAFDKLLEEWRGANKLEGLDVKYAE